MKICKMTWVAMAVILAGCATLFEQPEARSVRERIAIEASEDSYIKYGSDVLFYSDNKSSQTMRIEGATGDIDGEGTLDIAGVSDLKGNLSDSGGAFTVADNVMIDGTTDAIQLTVQGYTTQTTNLLTLETSAGTDKLTVSNDGNMDIAGTLRFGANTLYPVGYSVSGKQVVFGSTTITGTANVSHGLTGTLIAAGCTMGATPAANAALCTVAVSGTTVAVKVWKTDFTTAGSIGALVYWWVIGAP